MKAKLFFSLGAILIKITKMGGKVAPTSGTNRVEQPLSRLPKFSKDPKMNPIMIKAILKFLPLNNCL